MPLVTIIIPVYNTEKYLRKCLDSVVNQTYKNIEIIIINDASIDNSKNIINEYAKYNKKIKVITKTHNAGLSEARNIGLRYAQGDYIFFLDSDDYLHQNTIKALLSLTKNYNSQIAECNYTSMYGPIKRKKEPLKEEIKCINPQKEKNALREYGNVWNKLYRHDILNGFQFPKGLWYEDNAFIYPLLTTIKNMVITNQIYYYYNRHLDSITYRTKIYPNEKIFDQFKVIQTIQEKCEKLGTFVEYKEQLFAIFRSKLLFTLLEGTTWFQISQAERETMITNIFNYIRMQYGIKKLDDLTHDVSLDRLDKLRMPLLKKNLKNINQFIPEEEPLEDAKRIIAKYKR